MSLPKRQVKGRLRAVLHGAPATILKGVSVATLEECKEELATALSKEAWAALLHARSVRKDATYAQVMTGMKTAIEMSQLLTKQPTSIVQQVGKRDPREVLLELLLDQARETAEDVEAIEGA